MRDPNRIDRYLNMLALIWKENPDLRFSQLILNVLHDEDYYLEDDITYQLFLDKYVGELL